MGSDRDDVFALDTKAVLVVVETGIDETEDVGVDVNVDSTVVAEIVLSMLLVVDVRDHVEELVLVSVADVEVVALALVLVTVMVVDVVVTPGQRLLQL